MVSGVQGPIRREGFASWVVLEFPFGYLAYILGGCVGGGRKNSSFESIILFFFFPPPPSWLSFLRAVPANKPAQCDMPFPGAFLQARLRPHAGLEGTD